MNIEQDIRDHSLSILGKELKLIGDFHLKGEVHVYGELEGTIYFQAPGKLVIEQTGRVKGKINCDQIEIYGQVDGVIEAQGTLMGILKQKTYPSIRVPFSISKGKRKLKTLINNLYS